MVHAHSCEHRRSGYRFSPSLLLPLTLLPPPPPPLLLLLLLLLPVVMDSVSPAEHLCYVRCTYCNTVLAVGVPCKPVMDTITVRCGHCNHLSFLSSRTMVQSHSCNDFQMGLQGACADCLRGQASSSSSSSSTSSEQTTQKPTFVVKPPEKKHRMPSAYNRFMREEIQRIKASKPDIPHREAFSMAAKNWAKCDPRCSIIVSTSGDDKLSPTEQVESSSSPTMESSSLYKQMEEED
ncbi:protein DROOPING LEAF-like [Musa acuminata AAA Group]|uniref:protein DROOPING LEAF-like n=1 Tax=Musa acuminata AAA Group TaxID=214697 RepID=UPI0031DF1586